VTIPPGTLLEFTLTQPVTLRTGNWQRILAQNHQP
jgi:hypothetical protein